jgi:hypothetical protein
MKSSQSPVSNAALQLWPEFILSVLTIGSRDADLW